MNSPTPATPTVVRATVGDDWPKRWPCSGFKPGDTVEARYAPNGDLVGLEAWRDGAGIYPLDVEAAELGSVLATYGETQTLEAAA